MTEFTDPVVKDAAYTEVCAQLAHAQKVISAMGAKLLEYQDKLQKEYISYEKLFDAHRQLKLHENRIYDPGSAYDGRAKIEAYWRRDKYRSIWSVMRDELGLDICNSIRHIETSGRKRSPYKNSGEWRYYVKDVSLHVSVCVGSESPYDCSGALCGLYYTITPFEDFILVYTKSHYDY
jgi:hypothetical protein